MARHSHWHNIQATKGKADARRAKDFAKIAKAITAAVKDGGGDPSFNVALRVAIDAARSANMPKDNVERAIARGCGEDGEGAQIEEVIYEGFGPGGLAVLIQCFTDNRNRSVSEVHTVLMKSGGNMAGQGSAMWMFEKKGVIIIADPLLIQDYDSFELAVIEAGAEDIREVENVIEIVTHPTDLKSVLDVIEVLGLSVDSASLEYLAKEPVSINQEYHEAVIKMIGKLEELDDVNSVYTNEN